MSTSPERYGTIEQAADLYQVSTRTIRRMISRGEIDAKRLGTRLIRVNLESLENTGRPLNYVGGDSA